MGTIRIRPEADCRPSSQEAFVRHRARVAELIPGAEIEHVGSTSIPGALTKGDVDLLVRVEQADLSGAIAAHLHSWLEPRSAAIVSAVGSLM